MILRQATRADSPDIAAITNAMIRDTLITFTTDEKTPAAIGDDITASGPAFLVAEVEGRVVGFASYAAFRAGPGYAHTKEHTIHLAPAARGRGVGRALMQRLQQVATQDGMHVLVAGISSANPGAIAFHHALGFAETGRMAQVGRKAGRWLDLVLMQKILTAQGETGADTGVQAR